MPLKALLLIAITVLSVLSGLIILFRNFRKLQNWMFFAIAFSVGLWSFGIAFFLLATSLEVALVWARIYYSAALLIGLSYLLFGIAFITPKHFKKSLVLILPLAALITWIILQPSFLFNDLVLRPWGKEISLNNSGYTLYSVIFLLYFYGAHWLIFSKYRKSSGLLKNQLLLLLVGPLLAGVFGITFNLVLPWLGNYRLIWVGPIFLTLFMGSIFYAIVKHRLFDIRLVIARSIAYTMLLGTLGLLYGFAVFGASTLFFAGETVALRQQVVYAVLAVILAFTFQPLRRFFEKITDKIFYRDRYETQSVLNETSRVLAAEIDMKVITRETLKIISRNLKLRNSSFVTMDEGKIYKVDEYGAVAIGRLDRDQLKRIKHNILVTDELDETPLKHMLAEHKIAAILRLKTQSGVVGYLLLGPKESGGVYTNQDVGLLEILSNELAVAVENARSFEKIADFNITLQQRIKEATAKLRTQNVKLKELDRAKDEFISMASHQLRTPLTTIKGYLSMMLEGDAGQLKGEQHKFTDAAFMSAQRMVYLISDMLNVSRISTGRLTFDMKPLDLAAVAREEVSQLKRTADAKNVKLHFNPPKAKLPKLSLDEGKIRQVMMNFIDNAIYYAPDTTVEIYLEKDSDKVRFLVRDRGIGVPKREQNNLFTKFYRAENAKQARPDGTGLGLYMAKMVTEAMGGQIIFESAKGRGSAFGFEYSISETQLQKPEAAAQAKPKPKTKAKKSTQVPIKSG